MTDQSFGQLIIRHTVNRWSIILQDSQYTNYHNKISNNKKLKKDFDRCDHSLS